MCMDFLQVQFRAAFFMRHRLGHNVEAIIEITHRRMNDMNLGMDSTGRADVRQKAGVITSVHYGPWNGGGFHKQIKEMAADLGQNADENEAILVHFWPRIIVDHRLPPEEHGAPGRKSS